jgi:hypothetical protein
VLGQGGVAEGDFVGQGLGRHRRHAELAEKLQPLRCGEQRAQGDLREDPVESPLDVREEDRHRFAPAGRSVQEQLDSDRREIGATAGDGPELGSLCLRDQCRHSCLAEATAVQLADGAAA